MARRPLGDRVHRTIGLASRGLPVVGIGALACALGAAISESDPITLATAVEYPVRVLLFVLGCFVGAYVPLPGQPDAPSFLSAVAMCLALLTSLGGVALAVLSVFARELGVAVTLLRPGRTVVIGDTPSAAALARQLRVDGRSVIEVGTGAEHGIRLADWDAVRHDRRTRHAVRGASAVFIMTRSSVDGAIIAGEVRRVGGAARIFQMFDWSTDRLVFREPITDGRLPRAEVFAPAEIVASHIATVIAHIVRVHGDGVRVQVHGDHAVLPIVRERLTFMSGTLAFRGGVDLVDEEATADVVVVGVPQHEYVAAADRFSRADRAVVIVAPERYFVALGRTAPATVGSSDWLASRSADGFVAWRGRLIVVDEGRLGADADEISLGIRDRWAREFHNAHSDYSGTTLANRWLEKPPHPRLVTMARAAVDLMVHDLHGLGYELAVREGEHDVLSAAELEVCARHIHEQYLRLEWDDGGTRRRCADWFVAPHGTLRPSVAPPRWEDDTDEHRQRNVEMVRQVYPAFAATFGYRITRRGSRVDRPDASLVTDA